MLTVAGLSKSFGGRELFDDVSLNIMAGDRIAITGPNGAGKSTLIKIILGKEEPDGNVVARHDVQRNVVKQFASAK